MRGCDAPAYQCREFTDVQCSARIEPDASSALIAALRSAGELEAGFSGFGPEHPDQCCATLPVVDEDQVREKEAFQRKQWNLYVAQARAEKEARNEESRARAAAEKAARELGEPPPSACACLKEQITDGGRADEFLSNVMKGSSGVMSNARDFGTYCDAHLRK